MEFINVIPNMVKGFEINKGSIVLLNFWGENSDLEILNSFAMEIAKVGGVPIKWQQSREFIKNYFEQVPEEYLDFPDKYFEIFKLADVVIDIFMYDIAPHKDFPEDKFKFYGEFMRKLFGAITEEKDLFIQVRVPTEENAANEDIEYGVYKQSMYKALNIDFYKLKEQCSELVSKLKNKNKISIYTEGNNVLTFNLNNRKWYKDDGRGDMPCGEVYIAPVEDSANGSIVIPTINLQGEILSNVLLEFNKGRLLETSSEKLKEFINNFQGDKDIIAEFGIGLNENVTEIIGCTVIDEKCIGTAHIAIGMNDIFGGNNLSNLHMDFVFKPIKIEADGEVII